jgi:Arc/MetJ family transcription regulator
MMRTNIVIDDRLMRDAMKASGLPTKRAAVEAGLRLLLQVNAQTGIRRLRGKVEWKGDIGEMRTSRVK